MHLLENLEDVLPGWPVSEVVPPPCNVGAAGVDLTITSLDKCSAVREVLKISQGDFITSKVPLLAKDNLVGVKLRVQHGKAFLNDLLISLQAKTWLKELLLCDDGCEGIEVERLD